MIAALTRERVSSEHLKDMGCPIRIVVNLARLQTLQMKPKQSRPSLTKLSFARRADKFHDFFGLLIWSHRHQIAKYQLVTSAYEISIVTFASADCIKGCIQPFIALGIWKAVKEFSQRTSFDPNSQRLRIKGTDFAIAFQYAALDSINTSG
jgi:hypothetical protein